MDKFRCFYYSLLIYAVAVSSVKLGKLNYLEFILFLTNTNSKVKLQSTLSIHYNILIIYILLFTNYFCLKKIHFQLFIASGRPQEPRHKLPERKDPLKEPPPGSGLVQLQENSLQGQHLPSGV